MNHNFESSFPQVERLRLTFGQLYLQPSSEHSGYKLDKSHELPLYEPRVLSNFFLPNLQDQRMQVAAFLVPLHPPPLSEVVDDVDIQPNENLPS